MTIYLIIHEYDVDGGFGDAIGCEEVVTAFSTIEKANEFVKKYEKPRIYWKPYNNLYCGNLRIEEVGINEEPSDIYMSWLDKDVFDFN